MSDRIIELTRTIEAPPERVFRALTESDELVRWFPSSAVSDPRAGGSFEYRFDFPDAPERNHAYGGVYHEVEPNKRVSYPWSGKLGETRVDVELRPEGDATALTLRHVGWGEGAEWGQSLEMHREGWGFFVDNLASYLERGEDRRREALGMRTEPSPALSARGR
jgi:uncharacterized protein YndB with AHSA1/START domain